MGIDVEDLIITAMSKKDPQEGIKLRLALARKYMTEAEEYLKKGEPVQASEKTYKVAKEVVKALAEKFNLPEYQQAVKEGRWYTYTLGSASASLSKMLGEWVVNGWSIAYFLQVWGFHESKLSVTDIIPYLEGVKKLLENAEKVIGS
ncbi:PaREP1 family protein [Saccharolobus islandicus]|uniref:PaREP1 family protein n=1 Tax=Saccharolobus islandicus (strain M.16.4 / Kamchatka \|nr:PaREP1 family protein [Sulfolobus islandicus]ACR41625.1 PaREP1 family protein [Sulfolobus islandicus M.16.4]